MHGRVSRRMYDWTDEPRPSAAPDRPLASHEFETLRDYLRSPTKTGLWVLSADWKSATGISETILAQFEAHIRGRKYLELPSAGRHRRIALTAEQKKKFRELIVTKITFLNYLFVALHTSTKKVALVLSDEVFPEYEMLLSLLDLKALRKKYKDALNIFAQKIYHGQYRPKVLTQRPFFLKDGFFVLFERAKRQPALIALEPKALIAYQEFFAALGKVSQPKLTRVFSPEEEVFGPYFLFLQLGADYVFGATQRTPLLAKTFEEYTEESFGNCISSIGLMAEDYLERVYETLFREPCPKTLTLGQTYDAIHTRIRKSFERPPRSHEPLDPIYAEINSKLEQCEKEPDSVPVTETLTILRKILSAMKTDRAWSLERIDSITRSTPELSCFPRELREQLTDLIRFRNAVSHKTRIPIGAYEALRSMYCLVNFIIWWNAENEIVDWSQDQVTILRSVVERNSGARLKA